MTQGGTAPEAARRIEIQGHRGARGLFPENTMAGFAGALAAGANSLELDVVLTGDLVPVVLHDLRLDPDLTRTAHGDWIMPPGIAVRALTLAELRGFDVGQARPRGSVAGAFPIQCRGSAAIPTLAEVLADARLGAATLHVELKCDASDPDSPDPEALAAAVLADVARADAWRRVTLRSFDLAAMRAAEQAASGRLTLIWLTEHGDAARARAECPAARGWAPAHGALTPEAVTQARQLGLAVAPWTVNAPADMARLAGWGVDGLCTDRPDLAASVLRTLSPG